MGTRADFYDSSYEWLGSIGWDGYPNGLSDELLGADTEEKYLSELSDMLSRDDWTSPQQGWPWPWDNSDTTDFAYIFRGGRVLTSCFGDDWVSAADWAECDDPDELESFGSPNHPAMDSSNFTMGERSGLIVIE